MRKIKAIGLTGAVLLATAVIAEALLRIAGPEPGEDPRTIRRMLKIQEDVRHAPFVPDTDLGALLAPSRRFHVQTPDYSYTLQTDHAGFPNRDPWPAQVDVAVLGNSLITGAGVGYEGQFTTLLQHDLGRRTVLNFGIPGGGTDHQLRAYQKFAAPLRPKYVVSLLWLTWEIDNSLKFRDWLDEIPLPDYTEYRLSYGATDLKAAVPESGNVRTRLDTLRAVIDKSRLLRQLHQWSKRLRGIRDPVEQVVLANGDVQYLSARDASRLMRGWDRSAMPDIRRIFYEPLEQLQAEVEAAGGKFLVVLVPSKEELYAAEAFPEVLGPVRQARTDLAARQIPTLDLYPVLGRSGVSRSVFYRTDIHLNAIGNRVVSGALASWIARGAAVPQSE